MSTNELTTKVRELKEQITVLEIEKAERLSKGTFIGGFMFEVSEYETAVTEFDEQLWMMVIDSVEIYHDGRIVFKFRNEAEIEA